MIHICLDPGHGQFNNPGYAKGYYEGTRMFMLAYMLKAELEKYQGLEIKVTRQVITDNPELSARGKMAAGFDFFYSLHSNAPGTIEQTGVHGVAVYDSVSRPNIPLASLMAETVAKVMGSYVRGKTASNPTGVQHREGSTDGVDFYGVLRSASASACKSSILLEHGFHTNPQESAWLMIDSNLMLLAKAEAQTIAEYFKLSTQEDGEEMKRGDKSDLVKQWQTSLIAAGYSLAPYGADGSFGGLTETVTKQFQSDQGLSASGVVGESTFCAMLTKLNTLRATARGDLDQAKLLLAQKTADLNAVTSRLTQCKVKAAEINLL